jgi:type II secretory pathway pseudopilin PulG
VRRTGLYTQKSKLKLDHGAVLLLAMVFMLMLAMIAATVMQTAILQLHMAGNDQFLEEAISTAQAMTDELSLNTGNFPLRGDVGDTNCPPGDEDPRCSFSQLEIPRSAVMAEGIALNYRVTRQEPLLWKGFPIREAEASVSSSNSFDAALYEIDVHIDGSARRLGSAHIIQGIAVRVPAVD